MIQAVIFDLDGVIVSTDKYHYRGWKKMADDEGIYFDDVINERLRGVSRMESLEILLEKATKTYSPTEKEMLATRKNKYYRELLNIITDNDILPGVIQLLNELKRKGIKMAIGSSSKNAPFILERIGLSSFFDSVVDGNGIKKSKPHPEVFLLAAKLMNMKPENCLVVEDAEAGVEAAIAANMKVLAVGFASSDKRANLTSESLEGVSVNWIINK